MYAYRNPHSNQRGFFFGVPFAGALLGGLVGGAVGSAVLPPTSIPSVCSVRTIFWLPAIRRLWIWIWIPFILLMNKKALGFEGFFDSEKTVFLPVWLKLSNRI